MNLQLDRAQIRRLQTISGLFLLGSVLGFVYYTIHWPLTGDASLMHYISFLMDHGRLPYSQINDINLPMSYVPEWLVTHTFGYGSCPWRIYDLFLLVWIASSMSLISRVYGVFPAVWAGCLFALIHGRDGIDQVGQRDLAAAAFLVFGMGCLLWAIRAARNWPAAVFGLCAGVAAMIKPSLALFLLLALVDYGAQRRSSSDAVKRLGLSVSGWLLPVLGCLFWLMATGTLRAFWSTMTVLALYHASLGHVSWKFLLYNSVSPILPLVGVWMVVCSVPWIAAKARRARSPFCSTERLLLLMAAFFGYLSYLVQRKAYPYHRYPFLAFFLLVMAMDFTSSMRGNRLVRWLSVTALLWASIVLAPSSALKASRYDWRHQEFQMMLESDLARVAHPRGLNSLDGQVQCLDTITSCIDTLYHLQLVQSSGTLYDEFLFHPATSKAVRETRTAFWHDAHSRPPLIFVVTDPLFPSGPDGFSKLDQWPEFRDWLETDYKLETERRFTTSTREVGRFVVSPGYRLYVHR